MRLSRAFFQTLRDAPGDAELISHQLLLRAGFIQPLGAGIYSNLPLGMTGRWARPTMLGIGRHRDRAAPDQGVV